MLTSSKRKRKTGLLALAVLHYKCVRQRRYKLVPCIFCCPPRLTNGRVAFHSLFGKPLAQEDLDGVRSIEDQILSLGGELLEDLWTVEVCRKFCDLRRPSTNNILISVTVTGGRIHVLIYLRDPGR